ncbi:hypothetical protein PHYPSEUDO_011235 [Phytophthora pseudosyringae]|uniref:Uncharacterized protein n=1 Tax=Phytophthora pseudosyringae TaxID=221518 RepID=A0A8T1WMT1_9STRA|nr:hypothetical protein PHYPSEUDO_011235 [Phytophthora pseudosyringae]
MHAETTADAARDEVREAEAGAQREAHTERNAALDEAALAEAHRARIATRDGTALAEAWEAHAARDGAIKLFGIYNGRAFSVTLSDEADGNQLIRQSRQVLEIEFNLRTM